jgi:hypothetical protein
MRTTFGKPRQPWNNLILLQPGLHALYRSIAENGAETGYKLRPH